MPSPVPFLRRDRDGETVFDGLGVRVRLGEFLGGTLEVRASLFDVLLELLVVAVQLLVEVEVGVLNLGVLLPGVGDRSAYDDLEAVVLERAGVVLRQSSLFDERLHGLLYLRTQGLKGCFTLVCAHLSTEKLVDNL